MKFEFHMKDGSVQIVEADVNKGLADATVVLKEGKYFTYSGFGGTFHVAKFTEVSAPFVFDSSVDLQ